MFVMKFSGYTRLISILDSVYCLFLVLRCLTETSWRVRASITRHFSNWNRNTIILLYLFYSFLHRYDPALILKSYLVLRIKAPFLKELRLFNFKIAFNLRLFNEVLTVYAAFLLKPYYRRVIVLSNLFVKLLFWGF